MKDTMTVEQRATRWLTDAYPGDPDHGDYSGEQMRGAFKAGWLSARRVSHTARLTAALRHIADAEPYESYDTLCKIDTDCSGCEGHIEIARAALMLPPR